jgi:lipoate-protein ligase A
MNFARIIVENDKSAFYNMSMDEAISYDIRERRSPPTLRIYTWDRPSLSIGCFQKSSDINLDYCNEKGYPVVRRPTGGRAILHDLELTYSFSSRFDSLMFRGNLFEDYSVISAALVGALKLIGLDAAISYSRQRGIHRKSPACFGTVSYGEVTIGNRKVIGSAQKRYSDGFLQQGSVLIGFNRGDLISILDCESEEETRHIGSIRDYIPEISYPELRKSLREAFETALGITLISDTPTKQELHLAKKLESEKYSTSKWTLLR